MKVKRSMGERKDRKRYKYEVNTHSRSNDRKVKDPRNKTKELGEDRRRHSHPSRQQMQE